MLNGIKAIPTFAKICIIILSLLCLIVALIWLDAGREGTTSPFVNAPLSTIYPALKQMKDEVNEIRLKDDWTGLSYISPRIAHFWLDSYGGNNNFKGVAVFRTGGDREKPYEAIRKLTVPSVEVKKVLELLAQLPAKRGLYEPTFLHTDDYPSRMIEVVTKGGILEIYSKSQGDSNVPWAASFDGRKYVIDSDVPARAFDILRPYLQRDVEEEMVQRLRDGKPPAEQS